MFALMRKVCYGSRSRRGIQTTEILTTVYATCELRGVNSCKFMTDYLSGRVKSIPMPEENLMAIAVLLRKNITVRKSEGQKLHNFNDKTRHSVHCNELAEFQPLKPDKFLTAYGHKTQLHKPDQKMSIMYT